MNNLSTKFAKEEGEQEMLREAVKETIDRVFRQIDVDNNGYLSSTEINNFVKEVINDMGENVAFNPDDIQSFIAMVDNDRDGKISRS